MLKKVFRFLFSVCLIVLGIGTPTAVNGFLGITLPRHE